MNDKIELAEATIKRLAELSKWHIAPYNLGDNGEIGSQIKTLTDLLPLDQPAQEVKTGYTYDDVEQAALHMCSYILDCQDNGNENPSTEEEFKRYMETQQRSQELKADFLPVLLENYAATKSKEFPEVVHESQRDFKGNSIAFAVNQIQETYTDLIEIYKHGAWGHSPTLTGEGEKNISQQGEQC